jgi:hypothetical protein
LLDLIPLPDNFLIGKNNLFPMCQIEAMALGLEPVNHLGPDDLLFEVHGHLVLLFQQVLSHVD